jgi:hypothetical protein
VSPPLLPLRAALAALAIAAAQASPLASQAHPDVVRGTITGQDGSAIGGAVVAITRAPDRLTLSTQTDSAGRYSLRFAEGTGDYLVHVSAMGWREFRQRVTRTGADSVLVVNARLATAAIALAAVNVQAQRPKPGRGREQDGGPGATENVAGNGVAGMLTADQAGDLAQLATTTPGVTAGPGGLSALGLSGQTTYTLNGMGFDGGSVPRGMRMNTRVSMGTYDPARGGFGAAEVAMELSPGSTYTSVNANAAIDARRLQAADAAASRLGHEYTGVQLDANANGELKTDRYYYNAGITGSRRRSDAPSLLAADLLHLSGVSADSAARLLSLVGAAGVPLAEADARWHTTESVSVLGRLDRTPRADRSAALTAYGSLSRDDGSLSRLTATQAHARRGTTATGQIQGLYSFYFGREYLNEAQTALSFNDSRNRPYLGLPEGRVQVASLLDDGTSGVSSLVFGGGGSATNRRTWRWETTDQLQLYTRASAHKVKMYAQSRLEGYSRSSGQGGGAFTYASLADLEANRPSTFSRLLDPASDAGGEWSGALAVGDLWKAGKFLRVLYGARLEGNRYTARPAANAQVEQAFGVHTDHAPNTVHVSPRLGLTWSYRGSRSGGNSMSMSPLGQFQKGPQGVLRAGIGEFRSLLRPDLLSRARTANGLAGGERRLFCAGPDVPVPDWAGFMDDPTSVPTACAGSAGSSFTDAAPGVELFAPGYTAARSWRANVGWTSDFKRLGFTVEGIYSLNLDQPGSVDLNFSGAPAFQLAAEAGRPVFVPAGDIVPSTGIVSPVAARSTSAFGQVWERRSDLRSRARQLSVTLTPRMGWNHYVSATYTLADVRARERGFDGSTFGDPRATGWSAAANTPRHQVLTQAGLSKAGVTLTLYARAYSGLPYTPLIAGDVNGDGLANDRAFVFDPSTPGADAALADGMRTLLASAPERARECLRRQLGQPAARNGCRGPWSVSTNARVGLSPKLTHTGRRANVGLNLANPLAGVDRLVHGADGLRGWGTSAAPDPTLLYVQGFDPAARAFRYRVNPRFGATAPSLGTFREPFRLTLDVSMNLGRPIEVQQLSRSLRPGRGGHPGTRLTADTLRDRYARTVSSVYAIILDMSDSLLLTPQQTEQLRHADGAYRARADSVWADLGTYLAALPDRYDGVAALKRQQAADDSVWALLRAEGPVITRILTPMQVSMLPQMLTGFYASKPTDHYRFYISTR